VKNQPPLKSKPLFVDSLLKKYPSLSKNIEIDQLISRSYYILAKQGKVFC